MSWSNGFAPHLQHDYPLARHTWFRVGGKAKYFARPRDVDELSRLVRRAREEEIPLKVLGQGANVLISDDGFDGVVVRLDAEPFKAVRQRGHIHEVGSGVEVMPFARECCGRGLSGLEFMAGIPATFGGAVRMNAGGRHGEISRVVRGVRLLKADGTIEDWSRDRVGFAYRRSNLGDHLVISVELELTEGDPSRLLADFDSIFEDKIRTQPLNENSAGCIFRNPEGFSAGQLIDQAGLKGERCGDARVSERHANFIVAGEQATASDVLRLIDKVREGVRKVFNTELELEIDVWNGRA